MDVEEDDLFAFAKGAFSTDDILALIVEFTTIDDEVVIVAVVAFHKLDTLSELLAALPPGDDGRL